MACWLAALVLVGTLAAVVPAGATATAPSSPSAVAADAQTNSPYGTTAPLAFAESDDATLVGGVEIPENYSVRSSPSTLNGTLARVEDDSVVWRQSFSTENATTQVTDVALGPGGDAYALVTTRSTDVTSYPPETTVEVVHTTSDGDVTWRYELDADTTSALASGGDTLRATDQGVAVTHALPDDEGVHLAELTGGSPIWNKTYEVNAVPNTLRTTDDGYLVAGTVGFEDPWVLRTGQSGQVEFNRTIDGAHQRVAGAVPTDDGGALLAGSQSSFGGTTNTWVNRVDDDGITRWSHVYGVDNESRVQNVFAHRNGLLLVEQGRYSQAESTVRLRGVGDDGAQTFAESLQFDGSLTASGLADGEVRFAGVTGVLEGNLTTTTSTTDVPHGVAAGDVTLDADTGATSNETVYRGQNVRFADVGVRGETYELVRLFGEYDGHRQQGDEHRQQGDEHRQQDDVEPEVVRRVDFDDGEAVIESATLPEGEYVLRNADGEAVVLDDGRVVDTGDQSEAAFDVTSQDFFRLETSQTFVNAGAGEDRVSLSADSDRSDYTVHVSVEDSDGESVSEEELGDAFGDADDFDRVETVRGQPVAAFDVDEGIDVNVSAAAFDAGLYEVTVSAVDTRDAGASATARLVVAQDTDREVDVSLNRTNLTVPVDSEAQANVTLSGVDNGISALSLSANRTGEPAVRPDLEVRINASYLSAGAGFGSGEATASASAFDGSTGNGTVTVGTVGVETETYGGESIATGNNTVTFRVEWVVDQDGVPYAVPDPITVPFEVVESVDESDGEQDEGGVGAGGSGGESDSESGSDSESDGDSESGSESDENSDSASDGDSDESSDSADE